MSGHKVGNISETSLSAAQLALFNFTDDDRARLAAIRQFLEPELPQLITAFYDVVYGTPALAQALHRFERPQAEAALAEYLWQVLQADWSEQHIAARTAIGLATGETAVEHIWFFGCSHTLQRMIGDRLRSGDFPADDVRAHVATLDKVLAIDLAMASQAHREEYAEQLAERNDLLEEQNHALKAQGDLRAQMAQMLVHDMSGPLTTLTTSTDVLEHALHNIPERVPEVLELMRRNQRRLRAMMHDILDVYSTEDTAMHVDRGPVNLVALIRDVVDEYNTNTLTDQPVFSLQTADALPPAWADAELLARVVRNLLDNSAKYAPPEGKVEVHVAQGDSPEALCVRVVDSGPGIPVADRQRIFDKYFSNPNSDDAQARSRRRGVGLGLAFCRSVIEGHGGRIWIDEPPTGFGAAFAFTLPVWDEPPI